MAYTTKELEKKCIEVIKKYDLFFIEDVIAYLPCSGKTFYNHKLHELQSIKDALAKVRVQKKVEMRSKWFKSENATLQMGLMKLLSTEKELKKLAMEHKEHSGNMQVNTIKRVVVDASGD
jgi:hypothetical protein